MNTNRLLGFTALTLLALLATGCNDSPLRQVTGPSNTSSATTAFAITDIVIPTGPNTCPDGAYPKGLAINTSGGKSATFYWLPEATIALYEFAVERYDYVNEYRHVAQFLTKAAGQSAQGLFYFTWLGEGSGERQYRVKIRTKSACNTFGPWSPYVTWDMGADGADTPDEEDVRSPVPGPDPVIPPVVPPVVPPVPPVGSAYVLGPNIQPFASVAGSAITCTTSTITGDVGVSPGSSITGIPGLCVLNGAIRSTASSVPAQTDLAAKYAAFDALPCTPIAANLNGVTLTPGVYCSGALASNLTGTLTLNGAGFYLIRFPSTLITSAGSNVSLQGGATCGGIHFQVASSATLEGTLTGNVIAFSSITLNPGAVLTGRALARNAAVTLTTATMTNAGCN